MCWLSADEVFDILDDRRSGDSQRYEQSWVIQILLGDIRNDALAGARYEKKKVSPGYYTHDAEDEGTYAFHESKIMTQIVSNP